MEDAGFLWLSHTISVRLGRGMFGARVGLKPAAS